MGETLRGLMLYGFAFATIGTIAGYAAIAAFAGAQWASALGASRTRCFTVCTGAALCGRDTDYLGGLVVPREEQTTPPEGADDVARLAEPSDQRYNSKGKLKGSVYDREMERLQEQLV